MREKDKFVFEKYDIIVLRRSLDFNNDGGEILKYFVLYADNISLICLDENLNMENIELDSLFNSIEFTVEKVYRHNNTHRFNKLLKQYIFGIRDKEDYSVVYRKYNLDKELDDQVKDVLTIMYHRGYNVFYLRGVHTVFRDSENNYTMEYVTDFVYDSFRDVFEIQRWYNIKYVLDHWGELFN